MKACGRKTEVAVVVLALKGLSIPVVCIVLPLNTTVVKGKDACR